MEKALLDLGVSVNLLPYSVYKQLGLGELKPTTIILSLADRSVKIHKGVIEDVLVKVDKFYYSVDFFCPRYRASGFMSQLCAYYTRETILGYIKYNHQL